MCNSLWSLEGRGEERAAEKDSEKINITNSKKVELVHNTLCVLKCYELIQKTTKQLLSTHVGKYTD